MLLPEPPHREAEPDARPAGPAGRRPGRGSRGCRRGRARADRASAAGRRRRAPSRRARPGRTNQSRWRVEDRLRARRAPSSRSAAYSRIDSSSAKRGSPSAVSSTRTRLWSASAIRPSTTSMPSSDGRAARPPPRPRCRRARRRPTAGRAAGGCRRRAGRSSRRWRRAASAAARAGRGRPADSTSSWCSSRARIASGREQLDPRGRELDGQRHAVQAGGDRGHRRRVLVRDRERRPDGDRPLDEQADRRVLADRGRVEPARAAGQVHPLRPDRWRGSGGVGQPRDRVLLLAGDVQRGPARGDRP